MEKLWGYKEAWHNEVARAKEDRRNLDRRKRIDKTVNAFIQ